MTGAAAAVCEEAHKAAWSMPIEDIDVSNPELYRTDTLWPYFERLRRENPVHYCRNGMFGPYWSVTKFKDIVHVETHPEIFSSEAKYGGITVIEISEVAFLPMFISMDPPKHDEQRKVVNPMMSPVNLSRLEGLIRQRTGAALDELPVGEIFDWVPKVSVNLTTQMLATLFGFPWEDRAKLPYWSDVSVALPGSPLIESEAHRMQILGECATYMGRLWNERINAPPGNDLLSMMAHNPSTRNMSPEEFLGNMILLIVGGNDTTRSSMTGGLLALNQNEAEYEKLCANPELIAPSMVPEIIRWQTPLSHMRRTAIADTELGGKTIHKGDRVVMWYVSGNRDPDEIPDADRFIIDRERPRHHLSFGFGIHRCVGSRLAELQLKILWEELLRRWPRPGQIEVVSEPARVPSPFVKGYTSMLVRING